MAYGLLDGKFHTDHLFVNPILELVFASQECGKGLWEKSFVNNDFLLLSHTRKHGCVV